jgi:two-component system, OmpR family, response regulator
MKRRILLVEDDTDSGEALSLLLRSQGYDVAWAASGREALRSVRSDAARLPDLILLDLMLPDMDGAAVIERLAETGPVPPVVIHSASTLAEAQAAGKRIGAAAVLRKPAEWSRMKEVIERVCAVESRSD